MAGFSKLYCVGVVGGFMGADGLNSILFQILVGDANRQWLEVNYIDQTILPLGNVQTIIPQGPDNPESVLDACIIFFPKYFESCPTLKIVEEKLQSSDRVDFDLGTNVPKEWEKLREEARPLYNQLAVFVAELKPYNF